MLLVLVALGAELGDQLCPQLLIAKKTGWEGLKPQFYCQRDFISYSEHRGREMHAAFCSLVSLARIRSHMHAAKQRWIFA